MNRQLARIRIPFVEELLSNLLNLAPVENISLLIKISLSSKGKIVSSIELNKLEKIVLITSTTIETISEDDKASCSIKHSLYNIIRKEIELRQLQDQLVVRKRKRIKYF